MRARDVMSTNLVVVPPETPVAGLADLLASRGISAVPVTGPDGALLGLVTEGDLIRRLANEQRGPWGWFLGLFADSRRLADRFAKAHGATAADVMTRDLVTVTEDAGLDRIAQLMEEHAIRRVPVMRDGKLVGLVSRADLLRAILNPTAATAGDNDDRAVLKRVLAAMREQPWVDTFYVFPSVRDGVVSIYGFHRSDECRRATEVLIREVPGVKAVRDETSAMPLMLRASM